MTLRLELHACGRVLRVLLAPPWRRLWVTRCGGYWLAEWGWLRVRVVTRRAW